MRKPGFCMTLIASVFVCILLTACGKPGNVSSASREESDSLSSQDEEDAARGNEAEYGTVDGWDTGAAQWSRDFEAVKEKLLALPYSGDKLKALAGTEECPVPVYEIALSKGYVGQYTAEQTKDFRSLLEAGEAAEILVMQYSVEGDLILDYLNFDGVSLFRVQDRSRDKYAGGSDSYFEYVYDSAWFDTEVNEDGETWDILYGLYEDDMVVEIFRTKSAD